MKKAKIKFKRYSIRLPVIVDKASDLSAEMGYTLSELIRIVIRNIANGNVKVDELYLKSDVKEYRVYSFLLQE